MRAHPNCLTPTQPPRDERSLSPKGNIYVHPLRRLTLLLLPHTVVLSPGKKPALASLPLDSHTNNPSML